MQFLCISLNNIAVDLRELRYKRQRRKCGRFHTVLVFIPPFSWFYDVFYTIFKVLCVFCIRIAEISILFVFSHIWYSQTEDFCCCNEKNRNSPSFNHTLISHHSYNERTITPPKLTTPPFEFQQTVRFGATT